MVPTPHTYKFTGWLIFLSLAQILYFLPLIPLIALAFVLLAQLARQPSGEPALVWALIACVAPLVVLIFLVSIYFLVVTIGNALLSYLKVSPNGLEMRSWPYQGLRCRWEDIERVGAYKLLGLIPFDALYLKRADPVGPQITVNFRRLLGLRTPPVMVLSGFQGWPTGPLAADLRAYRPDLFPPARETPTPAAS